MNTVNGKFKMKGGPEMIKNRHIAVSAFDKHPVVW